MKNLYIQFSLLIFLLTLGGSLLGQEVTMAEFQFASDEDWNPESGVIGNPSVTIVSDGGFSAWNGNPMSSLYSYDGSYLELEISTLGYENIKVEWEGYNRFNDTGQWKMRCDNGTGYGGVLLTQNCPIESWAKVSSLLSYLSNNNNKVKIKIEANCVQYIYLDNLVVKGTPIPDTEKPVFGQNPNIEVPVDAGQCGAVVYYNTPVVTDDAGAFSGVLPGYTYLGTDSGHTYYLSDATELSADAADEMYSLGGHLVTITSQGENDFLRDNVNERFWMGLTDEETEGTFKWVTGEDLGLYSNWNGGEPNDHSNKEDWGEMYDNGLWNDMYNDYQSHFVIEFEGPRYLQTEGLVSGLFFPVGTTTNTFAATDAAGNTGTMSFTVTVTENISPTASNPAGIAVTCISDVPLLDIEVVTDEADNCTGTPTVSFVSDSNNGGSGSTASPYAVTRTYKVTDEAGNFITVEQIITAIDAEAPTITCPLDIEYGWTPAEISTMAWYDASDASTVHQDNTIGRATSVDDKSGNGKTMTSDGASKEGYYISSDPLLNNMGTLGNQTKDGTIEMNISNLTAKVCYMVVYYGNGTTTPSLTHSSILAGYGTNGAYRVTLTTGQSTWNPGNEFNETSYKNGSTTSTSTALPMPATLWRFESSASRTQKWRVLRANNRDWTWWHGAFGEMIFTDGTENKTVCDNIEGYLAYKWGLEGKLPANHTYKAVPVGDCGTVVTYKTPVGTDNCAGAVTVQTAGFPSGSVFPIGTTTNTFKVTDAAGNTAICSFDVRVNDNEAPVISGCPSDVNKNMDTGFCGASVTWAAPSANDNCDGVVSVVRTDGLVLNSGDLFPSGVSTISYSAADTKGNVSTCSFDVTVIGDNEDPLISCPSNIEHVLYCDRTNVSISVPSLTDNCTLQSLTYKIDSGSESADLLSSVGSDITIDLGTAGDHTIAWTATDASENTSSCSFTIHVDAQPVVDIIAVSNTTCSSLDDGQIVVNKFTVESGNIEYSINGTSWQESNVFSGLSEGNYEVRIRTKIGTCESAAKTVTVNKPTAIDIIPGVPVDATCSESADGKIEITVSGGDQTMQFDGSDSYVALDLNYNSTTAIPAMTVAAWVKVGPNSGDGGWSILDFDRSEYFNFTIGGLVASDVYHVSFNTRSSSGINDLNSTAAIGDDQWHFVVGVYNSTGKYIYIDGVLDISDLSVGNPLGSSAPRYAFIGTGSEANTFNGTNNGGSYFFEGGISDVYYFETAMTREELNELSSGTVPAGHAPLGYWPLNDVSSGFASNTEVINSQVFGSAANLYTFSCTKGGAPFSLDNMIFDGDGKYTLTSLAAGEYKLTATDNKGCFSGESTFTISEPEVLSVSLDAANVCQGEPVEITAIVSDGTGPYTYSYYLNGSSVPLVNGTDYIINGNLLTSRVLNNGDEVIVKVTDKSDCEENGSVTVTVSPKPRPIGIFHD